LIDEFMYMCELETKI